MADNGSQAHNTYSASEAAEVLSLGKRRVLQMLERGELPATKDDTGRWLVSAPHVHALLRERQHQDRRKRTKDDTEQNTTPPANDEIGRELLDSLRGEIEFLCDELHRRDERHAEEIRRRDHLLAAALDRIPELEAPAPSAERGSPEMPADEPQDMQAPEPRPTPQKPVQRRSWWARIIGA